jgi:hypothetical protein
MKPPEPPCEKKRILLSEYDRATQTYVSAVNELRSRMSTSPKAVYDRLYQAAEEARSKSELARKSLLRHTREHNC